MRILELQEYAKRNGFNSLRFKFVAPNGKTIKGKWMDAYFGMFELPELADGFMMVRDWREKMGDGIEFTPDSDGGK